MFYLTKFFVIFVAAFGISIFHTLTCHYVTIRQKHVFFNLKRITKQISKRKRRNFNCLVAKFYNYNGQLLSVNAALQEYNSFWTLFLSIAFPLAVLIFTYQLYGLLTANNRVPSSKKYFYALVVAEITAVLYLNIAKCAQVVKCNERCLEVNRRFYLKLVQRFTNSKESTKMTQNLLKVILTVSKNQKQ